MVGPDVVTFRTAYRTAAIPDARARAPTSPSRAAIRFSNTSTVGMSILLA